MSVIGARLFNAALANKTLYIGFPEFQYFSAFMQECDLRIAYVRDPPRAAIPAYRRTSPQSLKRRCEIRGGFARVRPRAARRCPGREYMGPTRVGEQLRVGGRVR